mgnify:CR=1 FL=1
MKLKILFYVVFTLSFGISRAQVFPSQEIDLNSFIQNLTPVQTEEINYEDLYENLFSLYQNPIDINRADQADFRSLFLLNENKINAIINHRQKFGPFLSLYELQAVDGLSVEDIRLILPFITIRNVWGSTNLKNFTSKSTENYLVLRADQVLEPSRGYEENKYLGSRQRYYLRYRMSHSKDFSVGFISEKDAGEKSLLDYNNFHLQVQNKGFIKNLVLGDYLIQFGQGLIFSAGFAPGKGSEPIYTTRRSNLGIKPYNSVLENGSMRGLANTLKFKQIEITNIVGNNKRDAPLTELADDQESYFSSILSSGFHRTETEILNSNQIKEQNLGGNILYRLPHLHLGFSVLHTFYNQYFKKRDQLYNFYEFTGNRNTVLGPNFSLSWQNFNFFGEAARSTSGGMGMVTGLVSSLGQRVEWALNLRNYSPDFHTFYGSAFSEGTRNINERGIYNGLKYIIKKGLEVSAFYDRFRFPWLKYQVNAPSFGHDYQIRILHRPNKIFNQYIAWHHEEKQKNQSSDELIVSTLQNTFRDNLVYGSEYFWNKTVKFQTKIQRNSFLKSGSSNSVGYAIMEDIEANIRRLQLKGRLAYFNTDDYDSRIYAYENDVLYAVSFPAYYGKGMRYYGILRVPLNRHLQAWIRWSNTTIEKDKKIGSGNDQLPGNRKNELKIQLKYSF